ncbi:MAG: flavodoxin family protein [Acidobacteria bacterium]|nr:flavodoxin family protein [Acidobacteriota bacterium]
MKATILLGTLKRTGLSNTETLCEFLSGRMEGGGIRTEVVKLVDHRVLPGTYSDMGEGDEWPNILRRVQDSEIVILATPVWWGNHSSEIQKVIERLDELHDEVLAGKPSRLEGKAGGVVITGDSDGAEHIIGNLCNFFNAVGLLVPPYATLSVLWEQQAKDKNPTKEELLAKYESDYAETADKMIRQLRKYAAA